MDLTEQQREACRAYHEAFIQDGGTSLADQEAWNAMVASLNVSDDEAYAIWKSWSEEDDQC